ncbi:MAG: MptD family putative ECF transporter S component [Propionibacterium sp.]|nr:MptD family putative ECF transporter S component [Propionibacterium sp.]
MANTVSPSTTTSPSARRGTAHLSPRTLINIGVFTAIYFVITYATGMLGFFNPFMMFVGWVVGILLNGTVIMLFLARTPTFGALTILNTIVGLLMFLTGHVWYTVLGAALVGLLADLVANSAHFRSPSRNAIAYAIAQLWLVFPLLPIFYQSDTYFASIVSSMGQESADGMKALFTPGVIGAWALVILIVALVGGWIGTRVLHRNFERAGVA